MKFQVAIIALLVATAAGHAMRGTTKMQPDVVAHSLLKVEEEWREQAAAFFDCNATATDAATECSGATKAFSSSCAIVVNAVVQASSGDRSVVREYLGDICAEPELKGWRQERCDMLAKTVNKMMTDNNYDNREDFHADKVCTSFWSVFSVEERARLAKENAEREAEEKRLAEEKAAAEKKAAEEKAAADKKAAEEKAAADKKAAEEKAAADKKTAEEKALADKKAADEEKRRLAAEADAKAKEAKAKADEAAERLAATQAEAARMGEEAKKKAAEAQAVAEDVKKHQALANKTASEAEQVKQEVNGSVATNASAAAMNSTTVPAKAENVTEMAFANATKNDTTAPTTPKVENSTVANKTVAINASKASNTSFIQAASCATRRVGVFALLSEKAAALGPVCEDMCKEIGVYPKCQCPGFAGQPASADDTRACIVKYCQDASNKCPNDGFVNCVAANSKVSALQWDAVMSHVSHSFESLAAAVRMSKNKK